MPRIATNRKVQVLLLGGFFSWLFLKPRIATNDPRTDDAAPGVKGSNKKVLDELKAVKELFDRATSIADSAQSRDDNTYVVEVDEGKMALAEYYDRQAVENVKIMASQLNVDYNTVIDMVFDTDFAKLVLKDE